MIALQQIPASERESRVGSCVAEVDSICISAAWPTECQVTRQKTDRCLAALRDASRLSTATEDILECTELTVCLGRIQA